MKAKLLKPVAGVASCLSKDELLIAPARRTLVIRALPDTAYGAGQSGGNAQSPD